MLGPMDKLILEGLEGKDDFVEAAQFVYSLKLKNEMLGTIAIDAISELAEMGLIAASGRTKIKITHLGKETLEKEGRLDFAEKSKIIQ
jgi:repressor of nif and glnA expression